MTEALSVEPIPIDIPYSAVTVAIRPGNDALMIAGANTLPIAMPRPISVVPMNNQ